MCERVRRIVVLGVLTAAALCGFVPSATGSVVPALTLDQSAGTAAGSSANLGVDLTFSASSGDSPKQLTLELPPGLLANASIDGGRCLDSADLSDSACQVGSGVVTADVLGSIPVPTQVTYDLVPPPTAGDLAGLAVNTSGTQLGSTGDIRIRPSGDPAGVGVTISLTLPNSLSGVPISISQISSTFDGLRYPTTCPAKPQSFTASVTSYNDPTVQTVSAPLSVTGCSALAYAPAFSLTAIRDSADNQVALSTTVTQQASEAPSQSISLLFPSSALSPNIQAIAALCPNVSSGTCTALGSVSASSPLYPSALTGKAYLTGNFAHPLLTLVFPPPFPLTLTGTVDLTRNSTTFTGLPDIPLTSLTVSLTGGPHGVFGTLCKSSTGTASATLTDQNGDRTVTVPANFTIAGCAAVAGRGGRTKVTHATLAGLGTGRPSLGFRLAVTKGSPALHEVTLALPGGLKFVGHRTGKRLRVIGVHVRGGRVASLSLVRGRLVIRLMGAARDLTVAIASQALEEASSLQGKVTAGKVKRLTVTLITVNSAGGRGALHLHFNHPGRTS
ncbi:MAG: hypothetical protein JO027_17270 [Solirubrobacterales bacterium]|nr:hypothetical protein [Solirubrobacterales bacterium]